MLTAAIADNNLQLYRTSHAVRSAITATAEPLAVICLKMSAINSLVG